MLVHDACLPARKKKIYLKIIRPLWRSCIGFAASPIDEERISLLEIILFVSSKSYVSGFLFLSTFRVINGHRVEIIAGRRIIPSQSIELSMSKQVSYILFTEHTVSFYFHGSYFSFNRDELISYTDSVILASTAPCRIKLT